MDFFKKKWVKFAAAVMFVAGGALLALGGADEATLKNIVGLILAAIGGLAALIAAIVALIDRKEKAKNKRQK